MGLRCGIGVRVQGIAGYSTVITVPYRYLISTLSRLPSLPTLGDLYLLLGPEQGLLFLTKPLLGRGPVRGCCRSYSQTLASCRVLGF